MDEQADAATVPPEVSRETSLQSSCVGNASLFVTSVLYYVRGSVMLSVNGSLMAGDVVMGMASRGIGRLEWHTCA